MIVYCGDSDARGPARYLLCLLKNSGVASTHIPPGGKIKSSVLSKKIKGIILSDYSYRDLTSEVENKIISHLKSGTRLLMVGGWGSFSGPFGHWGKSKIQQHLPVVMKREDDRLQFPAGALVHLEKCGLFPKKIFQDPVAICGINDVKAKKGTSVILSARPVQFNNGQLALAPQRHPLFVMSADQRSAALMTDLAPHWCGGLVDWGGGLKKISYSPQIAVQVGLHYIQFVSHLIHWINS